MFSEIAHHRQQHSFLDRPLHRSQNEWNPLPSKSCTRPNHDAKAVPEHNASFRQRLESPQVFARPMRSTVSLPAQMAANESNTDTFEVSEHMLRRKTPNGTLAAGYDGSPIEWTQRYHAMKHYLIPASDRSFQSRHSQTIRNHVSENIDQLYDQGFKPKVGEQAGIPQSSGRAQTEGRPQSAIVIDDLKSSLGRVGSGALPSGVDSVLHQSSMHQLTHNVSINQRLPAPLQPLWTSYSGPTSQQSPEHYGPFSLNGVFEPYYHPVVPAASSFQPPNVVQNQNLSAHSLLANEHNDQRLKTYNESTNACVSGLFLAPGSHPECERDAFSSPISDLDVMNRQSPLLRNYAPNATRKHLATSLVYREKPASQKDHGTPNFDSDCNNFEVPSLGIFPCPAPFLQGPTSWAGNVHFKDRVLLWAHRIYGNLLASIEQARRRPSGEQLHGSMHHRNFESKLPCPPYPSWSKSQVWRDRSCSNIQVSQRKEVSHVSSRTSKDLVYPGRRPPNARDSGTQSPSAKSICQPNTPLYPQWQSHDTNPGGYASSAQSSQIPPQVVSDPHVDSPSSAAIQALDVLHRLCQESGDEWIDGMLLIGCLAYGLGDYNEAIKWYFKVLRCDSNNVEATSNLAATLLALNRREDAEQYWLRSIKLRPNYFEAIEHLIGLLHEGHRGREAVTVIEYIERTLQISDDATLHDKSGYAIPASENGRMLALIHGKGNILYQMGDNTGAASAFENAILIGAGRPRLGIRGLIKSILAVFSTTKDYSDEASPHRASITEETILLPPEKALDTSRLIFPPHGRPPGLAAIPEGLGVKAAVAVVSNALLSLAKIYQDGMSSSGAAATAPRATSGVQEILALYYLSLSLQPSPSTANNVGILLAGVQQSVRSKSNALRNGNSPSTIPGVVPGSGIALALSYYDYGLKLDTRHAHLYTNLGSLFKDIGQLDVAIKMYEKAVDCDGTFDIALANLANAVKDRGRISDAIKYYKRAVASNPNFAEAVCGLANALNSVCNWSGRGGVTHLGINRDRWHVNEQGVLYDSRKSSVSSSGWIERVVKIVERQLQDGEGWGRGVLHSIGIKQMLQQLGKVEFDSESHEKIQTNLKFTLESWAGKNWEGAKVVRLIERATKRLVHQIYYLKYIDERPIIPSHRTRPQFPAALAVPSAPTVLPFHTFTCPLSAQQIRKISQRNGLRVSCSTLRASWLPVHVYDPPPPPNPHLNVGYISSDFNNHPLAHLMQSVFGLHDPGRVRAFCYATTASDGSVHRQQIEREAPVFCDASSWPIDHLVNRVVADGIHILINLNGYTRGARNEVFAARPAPVQMSFMGFAGTLGAEWCDYLLADKIAVPPQTLRPWRGNVNLRDQMDDGNNDDDLDEWVYGENIIFAKDTFFCCDHRQSAPDSHEARLSWWEEQRRRWTMRKELFPELPDNAVILGNFNQLYKVEPTTFRTWLRILSRVPKAVLWLLRFPDLGEENLKETALAWVGAEVASRIIFTDVAPKHQHISRARVCDLFLDTPECNAHTTAADVLWSGTPLLTLPRYEYKMCSRMAASILTGALPKNAEGYRAAEDLIADNNEAYEEQGVELASDLVYSSQSDSAGVGKGRLVELRKLLYESRWTSALFDTRRWVRDLEAAYSEAWRRWVVGEGGDIWL